MSLDINTSGTRVGILVIDFNIIISLLNEDFKIILDSLIHSLSIFNERSVGGILLKNSRLKCIWW